MVGQGIFNLPYSVQLILDLTERWRQKTSHKLWTAVRSQFQNVIIDGKHVYPLGQ